MAELPPNRVFTPADQVAFARVSGDRNPMHLDALRARRTQAGDCVVHGIHALLWALESLAGRGIDLSGLSSLRVTFSRFIHPGQTVSLDWRSPTSALTKGEIRLGAAVAVAITLRFGTAATSSDPDPFPDLTGLPDVSIGEVPAEPSSRAIGSFAGWLVPPDAAGEVIDQFPLLCGQLGVERIVSMTLLSTLVGMVCPGLHSIFTDLSLALTEGDPGRKGLGVRTDQLRLRLAAMQVRGCGFIGEVNAIERFPPVETLIADIAPLVTPGEFAGRRALIVGGSRGLGAATAKLIALGGGDVTITYARGEKEAVTIRDEIAAACGRSACRTRRFDVLADRLDEDGATDFLYYFATPRIFGQSSAVFDVEVWNRFVAVYVLGFERLVGTLLAKSSAPILTILYPSSVAVEERPRHMTEYAMAKAAGEILCADLARGSKRLRIGVPRLPRVLTDQTASVPVVEAADAVATMLPLLRAERPSLSSRQQ